MTSLEESMRHEKQRRTERAAGMYDHNDDLNMRNNMPRRDECDEHGHEQRRERSCGCEHNCECEHGHESHGHEHESHEHESHEHESHGYTQEAPSRRRQQRREL